MTAGEVFGLIPGGDARGHRAHHAGAVVQAELQELFSALYGLAVDYLRHSQVHGGKILYAYLRYALELLVELCLFLHIVFGGGGLAVGVLLLHALYDVLHLLTLEKDRGGIGDLTAVCRVVVGLIEKLPGQRDGAQLPQDSDRGLGHKGEQ